MPTVALRFTPLAEHVRTARLVAVSVARRAGFGEDQLDEIRIAIGEACARAVSAAEAAAGRAGLVDVRLSDEQDRLEVTVLRCGEDGSPLPGPGAAPDAPTPAPGAPAPGAMSAAQDELSLALMTGSAGTSGPSTAPGGVHLTWVREDAGAVAQPLG
ncbi:ATP-binding protein [Kineococcus indalonis]|uniref:ATP-binding protein n=1 Tax=Kineococcus indalonis TaxID=2696566 RepID=UPI001412744C|nr:ATP-binding protein [Kineococcus indalonis]NAZ85129.1 ATP-binding protein [Kineococcus indalonis]